MPEIEQTSFLSLVPSEQMKTPSINVADTLQNNEVTNWPGQFV